MADGFGIMNLFGGDMSGLNELLTPEQRAAMQRQGALSMAAQLLAASGPSRTPVSLGQALGQSYMAGQKGYTDAQQQALTGMLTKQKIDEYRRKQKQLQSFQTLLGGGGVATTAAAPSAAASMPAMRVGPTVERAAMAAQQNVSPQSLMAVQQMPQARKAHFKAWSVNCLAQKELLIWAWELKRVLLLYWTDSSRLQRL